MNAIIIGLVIYILIPILVVYAIHRFIVYSIKTALKEAANPVVKDVLCNDEIRILSADVIHNGLNKVKQKTSY